MSMSVEDLAWSIANGECYEFEIDDCRYGQLDDIPDNILVKTVIGWESHTNADFDYSYCLCVFTKEYLYNEIIPGLETVGFSDKQLYCMVDTGISLSNIVDMVLDIDAVKKFYSEAGYTKTKVRPIIYDFYANKLQERLNSYINKPEV